MRVIGKINAAVILKRYALIIDHPDDFVAVHQGNVIRFPFDTRDLVDQFALDSVNKICIITCGKILCKQVVCVQALF